MYKIYVDGSYRPENKRIGVGIFCETKDGKTLFEVGKYKKIGLNYEAEYLAVKEALVIAQNLNMDNIEILSDYQTLVNNLTQRDRSRVNKIVISIYESVILLKSNFKNVTFKYIPTAKNKAHLLAYNASKKIDKEKFTTLFHNLNKQAPIKNQSVSNIQKETVIIDNHTDTSENYIETSKNYIEPKTIEPKTIEYNDSTLDKDAVEYINKNNQEILAMQKSMNKLISDNQIVTRLLNSNVELKQQLQSVNKTMTVIEGENKELKNINRSLTKEKNDFQNTIIKIQQNNEALTNAQSEVKNFIDAQNKMMNDLQVQMKETKETIKKNKNYSNSGPMIITSYKGSLN